jgi:hypothetical protein
MLKLYIFSRSSRVEECSADVRRDDDISPAPVDPRFDHAACQEGEGREERATCHLLSPPGLRDPKETSIALAFANQVSKCGWTEAVLRGPLTTTKPV